MKTVANYVTCQNGHNTFVEWSATHGLRFNCSDNCNPGHHAASVHGRVKARTVKLQDALGYPPFSACQKRHKAFVIWSEDLKRFAFTCDECSDHSIRAIVPRGYIELEIIETPSLKGKPV